MRKYAEISCWKNVSSAKAIHIFSAKNIRILCTESAKTVNEMTLNELVKLMTLWTTVPRAPDKKGILKHTYFSAMHWGYSSEAPWLGISNEYPQYVFWNKYEKYL